MADWLIAQGDALEVLRKLPDCSIHMVMTSPPYYGLRSNEGTERVWGGDPEHEHLWGAELPPFHGRFCECGAWYGQLGLEPSPSLYVDHLLEVFRAVKRILRDDGTLFLNLGSSYAGSGRGPTGHNGIGNYEKRQGFTGRINDPMGMRRSKTDAQPGFKAKDLIPIPWMLGLALQADGWWLRNDVIWEKPNPMPYSGRDRFTVAHEYVLFFSKSAHYYFDQEAVREPLAPASAGRYAYAFGGPKAESLRAEKANGKLLGQQNPVGMRDTPTTGRNRRDVWILQTRSSKFEHYSAFPEALVEPCILAGTSEYGVCKRCGAPWKRIVKRVAEEVNLAEGIRQAERSNGVQTGGTRRVTLGKTQKVRREMEGWRLTCRCESSERLPALVLDPFAGLSTTGVVARKLGRRYLGIELVPRYADEGRRRLALLDKRPAEAAILTAAR